MSRMAKTGLLILSNPSKISSIFPLVKQHVHKTIYVQLFPYQKNVSLCNASIPKISKTVLEVYTQSVRDCGNLDVRILFGTLRENLQPIRTLQPIEVIIVDRKYTPEEIAPVLKLYSPIENPNVLTLDLPNSETSTDKEDDPLECADCAAPLQYDYVCLGGTFDRLHPGHKILLSEGVMRCKKKLIVGVTDYNMIFTKKLWELIEPCDTRIKSVKEFLEEIDPSLEYEVVAIQDPYGPTQYDPDIQLLVLSGETLKGGYAVNRKRFENGLPQVELFCLDIVEQDQEIDEATENKLSSTNARLRLLGTRLKKPLKEFSGNEPYVIGLVGGIASGKTSVAKRLVSLGAGHVECDKLAHIAYKKDTEIFNKIVDHFGPQVVAENGEIDRKELGNLVFNDERQLIYLESLVWPGMKDVALKKISEYYKEGKKIVILDAAVLLRARWHIYCHEIWTCLIPRDEAVNRAIERDNIPKETAECRVALSHGDVPMATQISTVVLCTFWSYEYTQGQVERAWGELETFLSQTSNPTREISD